MSPSPAARPVPRKVPQQDRSRRMVDRIVTAAHEVLLTDGHDAASTNRIARAAGISPGSLYQYFDGKEAVVDAVVERYSDALSARIAAAFTANLQSRGEPMVRASVEALLDALEENTAFLRVVVEGLPSVRHRARLMALEDRVTELVGAYLAAQSSAGNAEPTVVAWLLVRTVEQLTVRYVLDAPEVAREVFVSEVVRLVLGYVEPR